MIITTEEDLLKMYDRLLKNCDKAISNSTDEWALNFWKSTKEKLYENMSKMGLLKGSKTVH
mgnify:FL=1|jgi:hypothetical protein|tara:strand:+ start:498 stop:680 length:183 start_codon:yes stop_codon:yes gene_type:complete